MFPLDAVNGAYHAYSLRKLRSAYTGFAVRVRRSSDNTEQNIGFNVLGEFDVASYSAFVGAGNGFAVTIYDQTGNGINLNTATANQQAQIVLTGFGTKNKASLYFNGSTNWYLLPTSYMNGENNVSFSFAQKNILGSNNACLIGAAYDYGYGVEVSCLYGGNFSFNIRNYGNAFLFSTGWHEGWTTPTLCSIGVSNINNSELGERSVNAVSPINMNKQSVVQPVNYPPAGYAGLNVAFGRYYANGYNYGGYIGDFIAYKKMFTRAEIKTLNANMNAFYGIY